MLGLRQRVVWAVGLSMAFLVAATPAGAQGEPQINGKVNYVYATQFGFGGYSVGGLDVNVYSLPIRFTFHDIIGDLDLRVGLPIIYGHFTLNGQVEDINVHASTNSIAIEPRLWLDIPVFEHFRITPLGAWGFGTSFGGSGTIRQQQQRLDFDLEDGAFYTYQIGLSSLYQYPWDEWTFSFGNAFIYAGDADFTSEASTEGYGTFRTGIDVRHPLGFKLFDLVPDASLFFIYNYFTPSLVFTRVAREELEVPELFEMGATIGSASPLVLPVVGDLLDGMRLGLAYEVGDDFNAIHVVFGFPF